MRVYWQMLAGRLDQRGELRSKRSRLHTGSSDCLPASAKTHTAARTHTRTHMQTFTTAKLHTAAPLPVTILGCIQNVL